MIGILAYFGFCQFVSTGKLAGEDVFPEFHKYFAG
jgi:hypothetical protein